MVAYVFMTSSQETERALFLQPRSPHGATRTERSGLKFKFSPEVAGESVMPSSSRQTVRLPKAQTKKLPF